MSPVTREEIASAVDHTLLRAGATREEVERHCREAVERRFRAVCLFPAHLSWAARTLEGSGVILASAISFPHGSSTLFGKIFESLEAWRNGAEELDVVLDLGAIASGERDRISEEVRQIMERTPECRHKFIVETGMFPLERLKPVLKVMNQRRPAFVKTSTGVNAPGASVEAVASLRSILHRSIAIKASGGIRTAAQAEALLAAGATVLGTSRGVEILDSLAAEGGGPVAATPGSS